VKQYYECHITLRGQPQRLKELVESYGWKFSAIDGDPVLGAGVLCYATKHFNTRHPESDVIREMNSVAAELAGKSLVEEVVRQKVELVVYDTKVKGTDARESEAA
jgi:hypothetical protein